ncbi:ABC transporter permease [Streptosporangium roseum]|uniref:Transport permease protein n=1 Tax=Streptosporangium roseum (strain ATCC 12428 / DSM 43021 / JCM 3005 / KCTC 9067 / NCIMB 10171 / NRRL 2505 / NI 9100) TaxID=479432 RepID=D2BA45_STRRD|nr:ABC transporter permease [Streptosporangium roseum]ACZ87870.1 ABC transporter related protein [Streptosporangium roseum DSM 43021]
MTHVLSDGWVIARAHLLHWVRNPAAILSGLLYPIVMVLLFGYVFGSAMAVAGAGENYREYLMPGMFGQTMAVGITTTLIVVTTAASRGVTDRYRSMPVSQTGVVLGRAISDMVSSTLELTILVACGMAVGWSWNNGPLNALAAMGLLLLLRFSLIWVGIFAGLKLTPEAASASWMIMLPLTMVANTFVSPAQMPGWMGALAEWNPLSATVAACRQLFGNPGFAGESWAAQHAVLLAVAWPAAITLVFLPLSARAYRRLSR